MSDYRTHPDWLSLVRAASAAPADDLPRLVAADWLDEHGEPEYAEFIRVQCEWARLATVVLRLEDSPDQPLDEKVLNEALTAAGQLQVRERELFEEHGGRWLPDGFSPSGAYADGVWADSATAQITVRRGFADVVRCRWADWCDGFGRQVAAGHAVRRVEVTDREPAAVVVGWHWFRGPGQAGVPEAVWRHFGPEYQPEGVYRASFTSPQAATDALSAALIAWARCVETA